MYKKCVVDEEDQKVTQKGDDTNTFSNHLIYFFVVSSCSTIDRNQSAGDNEGFLLVLYQ